MSWAEYGGAIFALIAGFAAPFNTGAFVLASALSLGFAIHKGVVTGFGICPPVHVFLMIVLTAVATHVIVVFFKFSKSLVGMSSEGAQSGSGLWMLILFAMFFIGGPWIIYSMAANFTIDFRPACAAMFSADMSLPP